MLSNLYNSVCTIINQVPTSANNSAKKAWVKHIIPNCGYVGGVYDKSKSNMVYRPNTFTVYVKDLQNYRKPSFKSDGYYSLYETSKELYTANVGDLVIPFEVDDKEPTTMQEFNALRTKYQGNGGILTAVLCYCNETADGKPWRINHLELIKE